MSLNHLKSLNLEIQEAGDSTYCEPEDNTSYPVEDDDDETEELDADEILEQIQNLQLQLAKVRHQQNAENDGSLYVEQNKLIICTLNKPVKIVKNVTGDAWNYKKSSSGFNAAIDSLRKSNRVEWVSWPGTYIDKQSQDGVRAKLETDYFTHPVFFSQELQEIYHRTCCLKVLWPLFHNISSNSLDGLIDNFGPQFEGYMHANHLFLDALSQVYEEGDLVMVWGYELMLLPALIRRRLPDVTCGFYLGTPFPSTEFFRMLPVRQVLMQGMLGADLVMMNHYDHVRHFLNAASHVLGLESFPSRIEYAGRLISVQINPIGIDPDAFTLTESIQEKIQTLRKHFKGRKVIVSFDRLDIIKGIPLKLLVIESLLERYPELQGRVVFVLVADDKGLNVDGSLRVAVDRLVGKVNGKYGKSDYCPIQYLKKSIPFEDVVAMNAIASVALVTSLREGINMNALEFIACQQDPNTAGVLVYSEFAAPGKAFKNKALVVNPYDVDRTADLVKQALYMAPQRRKKRQMQLYKHVNHYTAQKWGVSMVAQLVKAGKEARKHNMMEHLDLPYVASFYGRSRRRIIFLDYDGTLVPHTPLPEFAEPPSSLINTLEALIEDPLNIVYIISGRRKQDLEDYFGDVANLGLVAEGGFWVKRSNRGVKLERSSKGSSFIGSSVLLNKDLKDADQTSPVPSRPPREDSSISDRPSEEIELNYEVVGVELDDASGTEAMQYIPEITDENGWVNFAQGVDIQWKKEVLSVLKAFTERTPGAYLENKECSFYWHFEDADPDFGLIQAKSLQLHFEQMLHNREVRVLMCPVKKYIVVQPKRVNKGRVISKLMEDCEKEDPRGFEFILAVGDERTDEDMYDVINKGKWKTSSFTCTVGKKVSHAQYFLDDTEEVIKLLQSLTLMSHSASQSQGISSQFGSDTSITFTVAANELNAEGEQASPIPVLESNLA
mmetsp:Transcript_20015/g.25223  ORF Transcript_20015/g.25223 Transcript_20015/m.25223 type:complete len:949 (-) Transcript_20015:258-3104(-)